MSQKRDAPAYQEYAANILAQLPFRIMTLQDRGLLYTMRLECWVNKRLPHNHNDLAKVLGLAVAEVADSLAAVMPFFEVVEDFIVSPELEDYRQHLEERKTKQSEGGKRGAAIVNGKSSKPIKQSSPSEAGKSSGNSQVPRRVGDESLVQSSTEKQSQIQSLESGVNDEWLNDYDKASNGE